MRTNLRNAKTLSDLEKAYAEKENIFEPDAIRFAGKRIGEEEILRDELKRMMQPLRMSTRDIELPGLKANTELIIAAVAKFKREVVQGADIRPVSIAGDNDIAIEMINILTVNHMTKRTVSSWLQTGLSVGRIGIFPPGNGSNDAQKATLDDNEWLFFTGDFIDFNSDAIVETIKYENIDKNTSFNPESIILSQKGTDMHMGLVSAQLAKSYVKIGGRATTAGSCEMMPVAVHICKASLVHGLT